MKKHLCIYLFAIVALANSAESQLEGVTVGLIGSQFGNFQRDQRISEIKNPVGYGIIVGYQFHRNAALALTTEFFNGNIESGGGTERDTRTNMSLFIFPIEYSRLRPYLSTGVVLTLRSLAYMNAATEKKNIISGRLGGGVDYPILGPINANGDLGFYTDGWRYIGWGGTLGLRYTI
jgi:hypothetical protein